METTLAPVPFLTATKPSVPTAVHSAFSSGPTVNPSFAQSRSHFTLAGNHPRPPQESISKQPPALAALSATCILRAWGSTRPEDTRRCAAVQV